MTPMTKTAALKLQEPVETKLDDDALVRDAITDPEAFASLYRSYAAGVYKYIYGRVGNSHDAEDLTTQVFLQVLESLSAYQPHGKFTAWLFTIARRRAADHHRRNHKQVPLDWIEDVTAQEDDGSTQVIQRENLERLIFLFGQLDEDKQELIRLRYAAGLTYRQIAQVLSRSEASVGMALHRIIHWFNDQWEDQDERD